MLIIMSQADSNPIENSNGFIDNNFTFRVQLSHNGLSNVTDY